MKKIVLIDPNLNYGKKLKEKLDSKLKPLAQMELLSSPQKIKYNFDLAIIHESFLYQKDTSINALKEKTDQIIWLHENTSVKNRMEIDTLSRFSSIQDWQQLILLNLKNINLKLDPDQNRIHLLFTFDQSNRHIFFQKWLLKQKGKGRKIFILPIKPLYFWNYRAVFHKGADFSDLILQAEQEIDLTHNDLGIIFEKQKEGLFLPRPGNYSDDFYFYTDEAVLKICRLFRDFILEHEKNSIALIDIEARPFVLVQEIASLCDKCHMDLNSESNFGTRRAKSEIANFLAKKNSHTQFVPINFSEKKVNLYVKSPS